MYFPRTFRKARANEHILQLLSLRQYFTTISRVVQATLAALLQKHVIVPCPYCIPRIILEMNEQKYIRQLSMKHNINSDDLQMIYILYSFSSPDQ